MLWKCNLDPNTKKTEQRICTFERKLLRRIYGPIQDKGRWSPRWNSETYNLYKDLKFVDDMKIRRLGWARHVVRMENDRIPEKVLNGEFHNTRPMNNFGGRRQEGHTRDPRNTRMEEIGRRQRKWRRLLSETRAEKGLQRHRCMYGWMCLKNLYHKIPGPGTDWPQSWQRLTKLHSIHSKCYHSVH